MAQHDKPIPELDAKGLRNFGLTTGFIFAVLFGLILPWLFERSFPGWPWLLFAVLAFWALIAPSTLRLVYLAWMRLGLLIGKITTPLVLGIVFFIMITPIGLARRMLGWDSMSRTFEPEAFSYRVTREPETRENLVNPY